MESEISRNQLTSSFEDMIVFITSEFFASLCSETDEFRRSSILRNFGIHRPTNLGPASKCVRSVCAFCVCRSVCDRSLGGRRARVVNVGGGGGDVRQPTPRCQTTHPPFPGKLQVTGCVAGAGRGTSEPGRLPSESPLRAR